MTTIVGWIALAPHQLGGSVSYVLTQGNSMEPNIHTGDLVMVREQSTYHGGDVVAYVNQDLGGAVVLHRIVGMEDGRYVFKGDNNDFIDPYHPSPSELVGKLWVRIPAGAGVLQGIRDPKNAAVIVGVLMLMGVGGTTARRRRGRHEARTSGGRGPSPTIPALAGILVLLFGGLALFAFTQPENEQAPTSVPYGQSGTFAYEAHAPRGPVYQRDIQAGDPVFLKLVDRLRVSFDYAFESDSDHNVEGTASMDAVLGQTNGWTHTIPLVPEQTFTGDRAHMTGTLDLDEVRSAITDVERLTGDAVDVYSVTLEPRVHATGTLGGAALDVSFHPTLPMQIDDTTLQALPGSDGEPPELTTTSSDRVLAVADRAKELDAGPLHVTVATARYVGLVGGIAALLALILFGIPFLGAYRKDEASRIHARYGPLLVPTRSVSGINGALAEMDGIEDLVRIADRYDRLV
ncbi:MAG TPA: signal peptidase I, partial [Actinomycetota bacterium]|nr:signal peptidase I [Actinomycetota bacterium]